MQLISYHNKVKKTFSKILYSWKLVLICGAICFFPILTNNDAYAISSQYEYENQMTDQSGLEYLKKINWTFNGCKVLSPFEFNDLYNVVIRTRMGDNPSISASTRAAITLEIVMPIIVRAAAYTAILASGIGTIFGLMALGADVLVMFDVCTNIYVIQPHEYVNLTIGGDSFMNVGKVGGKYVNNAPCAATAEDVPYYFQCDTPGAYGYDADLCSENMIVFNNTCQCMQASGRAFYTKPPKYCYARLANTANIVGNLAFAYDSNIITRFWNGRTRYQPMYSVQFVKPSG